MRVPLVLLTSVVLAVGLAGCGDDEPKRSGSGSGVPKASASASGSAPGASDPASPGAPGAPGGPGGGAGEGTATGVDKQVCDEQEKLVAESTRKFSEALVQASQGGSEQAAVTAVKALFGEWAAGMRTQAGKAVSAELKQALTEYAVGLEKLNAQIKDAKSLESLGDLNTAEIEAATEKVLRICG